MTLTPVLQARAIRKSFGGVEVLHGIDLAVDAGRISALLGENGAGKSTFVRIIAGDLTEDAGDILIDGVPRTQQGVAAAREQHIRLIHQEVVDAGPLSVAENIALGAWPTTTGLVRWDRIRHQARAALQSLGVEFDVDQPVGGLRLGERQLIEIAAALAGGQPRCLMLDEPTAALSDAEATRLFEVVRNLRQRGVAIIYITHRLDEVFAIADDAFVLRDGSLVLDAPVRELDRGRLVEAMVGRRMGVRRHEVADQASTAPAIELKDGTVDGVFSGVSLAVHRGEILALYGKVGSGAIDAAEVLFGARALDRGTLTVSGAVRRFRHPADGVAAGVGFVPADRLSQAVFRQHTVARNLAAPSWTTIARFGAIITSRLEEAAYERWAGPLRIRAHEGPEQPIWSLSGGNQQKVILGRWFERGSGILVLAEPTRGVDIGAREEIYRAIERLTRDGTAVIVATSDYEDVLGLADRAIVMVRGRIAGQLPRGGISVEALTEMAGGRVHA